MGISPPLSALDLAVEAALRDRIVSQFSRTGWHTLVLSDRGLAFRVHQTSCGSSLRSQFLANCLSAEMSSCQANSLLQVKFVNASTSTLRFYRRSGLLSSQRKQLKTLTPPTNNVTVSSFEFPFEDGTNEFIDVEYKVEMGNQVDETGSVRRRPGYEPADVGIPIDSTILLYHSKITVVDSEVAQRSADASSRKKFELRKEPRAVQYEVGWVVTLVMILFSIFTYVFSGVKYGLRNLIPATQSRALISEPPVEGTDAGRVPSVRAAV